MPTSYIEEINYLQFKEKDRDKDIYNMFKSGITVNEISESFILSPRYIQFILRNQRLLKEWENE